MSDIKGIVVYSAGAIDLAKDLPQWRKMLTDAFQLYKMSTVVFDPSTAFKTSCWGEFDLARSMFIEDANNHALLSADYFVVYLPSSTLSVGTPIELDLACKNGKQVVLVSDIKPGKSAYLDNRIQVCNWIVVDPTNTESLISGIDSTARRVAELANPKPCYREDE